MVSRQTAAELLSWPLIIFFNRVEGISKIPRAVFLSYWSSIH